MNDPLEAKLRAYRYLTEHVEIFEEIAALKGDEFQIQKVLRTRFPDEVVRLALTVAELRRRAAKKFPQAARMWFDRERLEQATPWEVAVHKSRRFSGEIRDYCCGLGADAVALAGRGRVLAVDADPVACLLTELNASALGVADQVSVVCRRLEELPERAGLLHLDPDRRAGALKRAVKVEDYVPDLDTIRRLITEFRGGAVKVSPAANFGGKFDEVEIELVSLHGEAKEATIWFGEPAVPDLWRATILPGGETLAGDPMSVEPVLSPLGGFLYDPDPALVRAGLIDLLCAKSGFRRLDDAEEYLTSDTLIASPFAAPFRVLAELPNNERGLRKHLREAHIGRLEIKARRLPIDIERLHRTLPKEGDHRAVLIYARIAGRARIVVAERVAGSDA